MDISRYIEGGTRLSAEELRPGLSSITFQAEREIYIYTRVCVYRSRFDTRNRCTFQPGHDVVAIAKRRSVVYDAFASSLSRWKDAVVGMIEFGLSTGRGIDFGIDDGRGNRGSKTLRSAHKYVNAIQEDNEPLKVVQRRLSGSCVPANLIAVVFTGRVNPIPEGNSSRFLEEIFFRSILYALLYPLLFILSDFCPRCKEEYPRFEIRKLERLESSLHENRISNKNVNIRLFVAGKI